MNKVIVELDEADALLFRRFREHQDVFNELLKGDVFNTRSGYVMLMFNADARLMEIRKNQEIRIRAYYQE